MGLKEVCVGLTSAVEAGVMAGPKIGLKTDDGLAVLLVG